MSITTAEDLWKKKINGAYTERNMCISLIVRMAIAQGLKTGVRPDTEWPVVFVELPSGQVSWHIPSEEFHKFFPSMNKYDGEWDGHTPEEKYRRVMGEKQIIRAGHYTTEDGRQARIDRDSRGLGALGWIKGVGPVGYDNDGKPESEEAPAGLALKLDSWRPLEEKSEQQ